MSGININYKDREMKYKLVSFICLVGIGATVYALYRDFFHSTNTYDLTLDLIYFIVFSLGLLCARYRKCAFSLTTFIGFQLLLLGVATFAETGGLNGNSEYLLMISSATGLLLLEGKQLRIFMVTLLILFSGIIGFVETILANQDTRAIEYTPVYLIISFLGTIGAIIYLKKLSEKYTNELIQNRMKVQKKIQELEEQNSLLEEEQSEINRILSSLEERVHERTTVIRRQNRDLEKYIELNITSLKTPVKETVAAVKDLHKDFDNPEVKMMIYAALELNKVSDTLLDHLQNAEEIDTTVLKKNTAYADIT